MPRFARDYTPAFFFNARACGRGGEVRIDKGLALSSGVGRGGKGAIERDEGARGAAESTRRKERGPHRASVARGGRSEAHRASVARGGRSVGRGGKGAIERGEGARGAAESTRRKERGPHRASVARDGRSGGATKWEQGARDGEPVGVSGVACSRLLGSTHICHASFRAIHILRAAKEWLTYNGSIISHI